MSKIEWTDLTINPIVGCSKCSPGCAHCYAEKMAYRLSLMPATASKYAGVVDKGGWTGKVSALDLTCFDRLPNKPCKVFVGSMTDVFLAHSHVLDCIFSATLAYPQHTFLFLTKRPEAMKRYMEGCQRGANDVGGAFPWKNVWLGVTVCNQQEADKKIPLLLQTPAAKRFVSIEPMLGPVDISKFLPVDCDCEKCTYGSGHGDALDWIIAGGETGPGARPMHPEWVRGLRDQCQAAKVPFFFKQMSKKGPIPEDLLIREFPHA